MISSGTRRSNIETPSEKHGEPWGAALPKPHRISSRTALLPSAASEDADTDAREHDEHCHVHEEASAASRCCLAPAHASPSGRSRRSAKADSPGAGPRRQGAQQHSTALLGGARPWPACCRRRQSSLDDGGLVELKELCRQARKGQAALPGISMGILPPDLHTQAQDEEEDAFRDVGKQPVAGADQQRSAERRPSTGAMLTAGTMPVRQQRDCSAPCSPRP